MSALVGVYMHICMQYNTGVSSLYLTFIHPASLVKITTTSPMKTPSPMIPCPLFLASYIVHF